MSETAGDIYASAGRVDAERRKAYDTYGGELTRIEHQ